MERNRERRHLIAPSTNAGTKKTRTTLSLCPGPDCLIFKVDAALASVGQLGLVEVERQLLPFAARKAHALLFGACATVAVHRDLHDVIGPLLAGLALQTEFGWRLAFLMAAAPSFPLLVLFSWIGREPERGASEACHAEGTDQAAFGLSDLKLVFANRTNILLFLQGIPGSIPWGLLPFWIITFFRESRGFEAADATAVWEIFGIATVVGGLLWAILGDWLFNRRASLLAALCTVVILAGMAPLYLLLNIEWTGLAYYLALAVTGGLMISVASANVRALLMNVNLPRHRGSVFAVYNFADNIGKGAGPALGGLILAVSGNYLLMVNLAISSWLLCALFFAGVIFTVDRDRQSMLAALRGNESEQQT